MNRKDADALIGQRVVAWTAMNGEYVGTLTEVFGGRWRGSVLVTGTLQPAAVEQARRDRQRNGFRPGDTIEVGGSSIRPTDAEGVTYEEALARDAQQQRDTIASGRDRDGVSAFILEHRLVQLAAESPKAPHKPRRTP